MSKLDLKKEMKEVYIPSAKEVSITNVPGMNYIMTDGEGDPNGSEAFHTAVEVMQPDFVTQALYEKAV